MNTTGLMRGPAGQAWLRLWAACLLLAAGLVPHHLLAQDDEAEKTLSPYFLVKSQAGTADEMPLKRTQVSVKIAGMVADVTVQQQYENTGQRTLEAIYVFPASTRAAVYGMTMQVGQKRIKAKIAEKKAARQQYEDAKAQGKTASLLEQVRPNIFRMELANIQPGDQITSALQYTELLDAEKGTYEFVYPTVVAPRYTNDPEMAIIRTEQWVRDQKYLNDNKKAGNNFVIDLRVEGGVPLRDLTSPSHKIATNFSEGRRVATIELDNAETGAGNRDFILNYRLAGETITSGMLLFPGADQDGENFFMATVQPPARASIAQAPPAEYVFIVDVSGSMEGFPLKTSKTLMRNVLGNLRPTDKFNVVFFETGTSLLFPSSQAATEQNMLQAFATIEGKIGGGGTDLMSALRKGFRMPTQEGLSRTFVLITDGFVTVEQDAFDLVRSKLGTANLFTMGIGGNVNRFLIEGLARMGMGEPLIITTPDQAEAKARRFAEYVSTPVLTNVDLSFEGFEAYDVEPLSLPDVLAERPVIVFGKYRGQPTGQIKLAGKAGNGSKFAKVLNVADYTPSPDNQALRYLWARKKINILQDYVQLTANVDMKQQVTNLGLEYNLLTAYTSFIAIDESRTAEQTRLVRVTQNLPMPENMGAANTTASVAKPRASGPTRGARGPKGSMSFALPNRTLVHHSKATITWEPPAGVANGATYIFQLKNPFGDVLLEKETKEASVTIDLGTKELAKELGFTYLVMVKGQPSIKSAMQSMKCMRQKEEVALNAELVQYLDAKSGQDFLDYALFMEKKNFLPNAYYAFQQAILLDGSATIRKEYEAFLERNQ